MTTDPLAALLARLPLAPLGPGSPDEAMRPAIEAASRGLPPACRAGLWLAFDFLHESHEISQGLHTPEGSYWHAIMHRREPDAANAKYWFRRVGEHPALRVVGDPIAFIDLCERHRATGGEEEERLRRLQQEEWRLLFDLCR